MNCCAIRFPVENVDYSPDRIHLCRARSLSSARTRTTLVGKLVGDTIKQRGKIIIPAFSVGRTQQIVYVLHELTCAGKLPAHSQFSWTAR